MKSLESIINEEVALTVERIRRASRAAALAAFEQHFDQPGGRPQPELEPPPSAKTADKRQKGRRRAHRSTEEIVALETQLLAAVCASPGQSLAVLAPRVGAKPSALRVPVVRLKEKKQIKLIGQGQSTCYFPVDQGGAALPSVTQ